MYSISHLKQCVKFQKVIFTIEFNGNFGHLHDEIIQLLLHSHLYFNQINNH